MPNTSDPTFSASQDEQVPPSTGEQPIGRRRKQRRPSLLGHARDRSILWFLSRLLVLQRRVCNYMNIRTRSWNRRQQRWFLVLFVLGFQSLCVAMFFWQPASTRPGTLQGIEPAATMPKVLTVPPKLTRTDSINLVGFRRRLDSLMSTQAGRDSVAAFNRNHPGFIDSVLRLSAELRLVP